MADPADLTDTIAATAQAPAEAEADGVRAKAQPLPDVIKADQYLAAKAAASRRTRGLRITKLLSPGAT